MNSLTGQQFVEMLVTSAYYLKQASKQIDDLNVFPVPDGDTGSNMLSTFLSGIKEIQGLEDTKISEVAKKFSKGCLFGARGNSGVILSQIFSGLANADSNCIEADSSIIIEALNQSKISAYKSVLVPVEGTILTVISDATKLVVENQNKYASIEETAEAYLEEAVCSLDRTPLLLPVLKEAGVVDSGGAGFVTVIKGMVAYLHGETHTFDEVLSNDQPANKISTKDYMEFDYYELNTYGYCTEFTIRLNPNIEFDKQDFTKKLEVFGYSIVVVNTDDIVKCHIHTKTPGDVFTFAQRYGALCAVKAENMAIQTKENSSLVAQKVRKPRKPKERKKFGVVAVVNGDGLKEIFKEFGVDEIVDGGQTMNPSTQDFIDAINKVNAEHVFIIPNNKNVYMSAKTAKALINDKHVIVIPAKTIAQGYAAMTCFDETQQPRQIVKDMEAKIASIQSGEITYAIRNSVSSGIVIRKDDFIGILDGTIINSLASRLDSLKDLLSSMIKAETTTVTVFYGEGVSENEINEVDEFLNQNEEVFHQLINGGQKIYSYIIEVE